MSTARLGIVLAALAACGTPHEPRPLGEGHPVPVDTAKDPYEGVFPPAWKLGDRWRVSMKTDVPTVPIMMPRDGPDVRRVEVVYEFKVTEVANDDDGLFRLKVSSSEGAAGPQKYDGPPLRYVATYRKAPFSFVSLVDDQGRPVTNGGAAESNPPIPYTGEPWGLFIKNFPVMPADGLRGMFSFQPAGQLGMLGPATQVAMPTRDGLRFTLLTRTNLQVTIDWKHGSPWWSSIECKALPLIPPPPPPAPPPPASLERVVATGELLE